MVLLMRRRVVCAHNQHQNLLRLPARLIGVKTISARDYYNSIYVQHNNRRMFGVV